MIRFLRDGGHAAMPWKNGGGTTTEIAVHPEDAGLDGFEWRVSMARVEKDGPFSIFPGIDRTLAVLDGQGIFLEVDGGIALGLSVSSDPASFPADVPTMCRLIDGPITDLNVMARRGLIRSSVERIRLRRPFELQASSGWTLIFVERGRLMVDHRGGTRQAAARDCILCSGASEKLVLKPLARAELILIRLERV